MTPLKISISLQKFSVSDRDILNKKVNANKKYLNVKPRISSGYTMKDKEELDNDIKLYYMIKPDEVFRRISLINLMQLMVTYAKEHETKPDGISDSSTKLNSGYHSYEESFKDMPFLIVDVRPTADFQKAHIASSISHPNTKMSRTVGWECPEFLVYKNHPEWIIVLYDDKETVAPEVITTLLHRGYENVFMLSGGQQLAVDKMGYPFVTSDPRRILSPSLVEFICNELTIFNGTCLTHREEQSENNSVHDRVISPSKSETVKEIPWR